LTSNAITLAIGLSSLPALVSGTHAGYLDAARELIDGGQWLVLTSVTGLESGTPEGRGHRAAPLLNR
jgi:hypothetical protein